MKTKKLLAMVETLEALEKHLKREKDNDGLALLNRAKNQLHMALKEMMDSNAT